MKRTFIPLLFLATLTVSACVTAGGTQTATEQPLPVPDVSSLKPEWIQNDCNNRRMTYANYQLCLAYIASQLPPFDPAKREHFGEQYSPQKFLQCARKGRPIDGACEQYRLRRVENPEYWPYPDVPKPKWPDAPKEPVYKPGMSSKEYFEALCKAEAGEFIYKTVENVEGVYQVRPRRSEEGNDNQFDRYVMEDPYDYTKWEATSPATLFVDPPWRQFTFFEHPLIPHESQHQTIGGFVRYSSPGIDNKTSIKTERVEKLISRYGYTWRGISRPHDRELNIAGGELIVLDIQSNEILGVRRGFARSGMVKNSPTGIAWKIAEVCPKYGVRNGRDKDVDFIYWFISKVLKPSNQSVEKSGEQK